MVRIGSTWWISTVDIGARRGLVMAVDDHGELVDQVPISDSVRYHPGGMDFDGAAMWIPCAEYCLTPPPAFFGCNQVDRPSTHSTSTTTSAPWPVAVRAATSSDGRGARATSIAGRSTGICAARVNPAFFVDHQDCQWIDGGYLSAAELPKSGSRPVQDGSEASDCSTSTNWRWRQFRFRSTRARPEGGDTQPAVGRAGDDQLIVHLLPDDGVSAILSYATPIVGRSGRDDGERVGSLTSS
jgi:hypothetical protein